MAGIVSVVVATALVPLAAAAGEGRMPDGPRLVRVLDARPPGAVPPAAAAGSDDGVPGGAPGAGTGPGDPSWSSAGNHPSHGNPTAPGAMAAAGKGAGTPSGAVPGAGVPGATRTRCGPELASPDGVEAQTCVLTDGRATWGRTYYRNATGTELTSVLTLMGPGRRTLQMNCVVEAGDEPGVCETPKVASRGLRGYSAVAEFAAAEREPQTSGGAVREAGGFPAGGPGAGPLLLRSGSNSGEPAER